MTESLTQSSTGLASGKASSATKMLGKREPQQVKDEVGSVGSASSVVHPAELAGSGGGGKQDESARKRNRRRPWTEAEDAFLTSSMKGCSTTSPFTLQRRVSWLEVAKLVDGRTSKQCRDRWLSICPTVAKREWTKAEDQLLIELYKKYKNRWVKIAACFEGRNDNMIKSRFRALSRIGLVQKLDGSGGSDSGVSSPSQAAAKRLRTMASSGSVDDSYGAEDLKRAKLAADAAAAPAPWTVIEDKLLLSLHQQLLGQYSAIATILHRSVDAVKLRILQLGGALGSINSSSSSGAGTPNSSASGATNLAAKEAQHQEMLQLLLARNFQQQQANSGAVALRAALEKNMLHAPDGASLQQLSSFGPGLLGNPLLSQFNGLVAAGAASGSSGNLLAFPGLLSTLGDTQQQQQQQQRKQKQAAGALGKLYPRAV